MNTQFSFYDETYNQDSCGNYLLRLYLTDDFIAWTAIDTIRNKFVSFRSFQLPALNAAERMRCLNDVFSTENIDKMNFRKSQIIVFTPVTLLVPTSIEGEETNKSLIDFTFKNIPETAIIYKDRVNADISCLFAIPEDIKNKLSTLHEATFTNPYTLLLQQLFKHAGKDAMVMTEMFAGGMIIAAVQNEKLLFCNHFRCEAPSDFAYHMAGVYKSVEFDLNTVPILVSGITESKDDRITQISRFVKKVVLRAPTPELLFSYRFNEIPRHWFSLMFDMPYENH